MWWAYVVITTAARSSLRAMWNKHTESIGNELSPVVDRANSELTLGSLGHADDSTLNKDFTGTFARAIDGGSSMRVLI